MTAVAPPRTEREPRGARRKRETHDKLLAAGFQLMSERGVDAVAINDITEAADVGFGSFYNHFASKETLYDEICTRVFEEFADALDGATGGTDDAAEVIAISVRHTILRAEAEPRWGRFLAREALTPRSMGRGLARRLLRDLGRGIDEKRFVVADPLMAFIVASGTVIASIAVQMAAGSRRELGGGTEQLAERTAATLLRCLGLGAAEAARIARRRLPPLARA